MITIWGGGDYQLRSALAAKQIWVAVITIWGALDSLPRLTWEKEMQADVILKEPPPWVPPLSLSGGARVEVGGGGAAPPRTPLAPSFFSEGGHCRGGWTLSETKKMKMKQWKEGNKNERKMEKGEKIGIKSKIFNFYPILWNDRAFKLFFLYFEKLILFPSFIRLMILMKHQTARRNMETNLN